MSATIPLRFDVYQGGNLAGFEELDQEIIKVGKLSSSHLRIDDAAVSRMHAVIEVTSPTEAFIIDLGSARGTIVNGERVNKHLLVTGDRIQLGQTTLVVWVGADDIERARRGEAAAPAKSALAAAAPAAAGAARPAAVTGHEATATAAHAASADPVPTPQPTKPRFEVGAVQYYYEQQDRAQRARWAAEGAQMEIDDPKGGHVLEVVEMTGDTVHTVKLFSPGTGVLLGDRPKGASRFSKGGADYVVDTGQLGAEQFQLVNAIGEQYALQFTDVMSGQVQSKGQPPRTLASTVEAGDAIASGTGHQLMLDAGTTARVNVGGGTFLMRVVAAPRVLATGGGTGVSRAEAGYMTLSFLAHLLFMFLAFIVPPDIDGFRLDSFDANNRFVKFIVQPPKTEEPDVPDWFEKLQKQKKKAAKAKGDQGKAGKKDSKEKDKKMAIKGPKDNKELQIRRAKILEKVRDVGALRALSDGGLSSTLFGTDRTIGSDAIHAMGGWSGKTVGVSQGFGGFGAVGMGRGGGGFSENSLGVGGIGLKGRAGGDKKFGRGAGNLGERSGRVPKVIPGKASVTGALDKAIIRRVINKNRQAIKYCYDKELQKKKDLHGKIVVTFVISPTGRVVKSSVKQSTMKNKSVEDCIAERVRRFKFPAPKGGGIVEVSYPFIFKAS